MTFVPRNPPIGDPPIRLAVCVSGGGTTLDNLLRKIGTGALHACVAHVIADRPGIAAIDKASAGGIACSVVARKGATVEGFSERVFRIIRGSRADLVVLGGFLSLVRIPEDYGFRVINIHPSLIPSFCGKGFHGKAVHQAAIDQGVKVSGCTVHFADNTYDTGPIIAQHVVPVLDDDTAGSLAARVFQAECEALPEAITLYAAGRLRVEGRRVRIV